MGKGKYMEVNGFINILVYGLIFGVFLSFIPYILGLLVNIFIKIIKEI